MNGWKWFRVHTGAVVLVAFMIRLLAGWWTGELAHPSTWEYEQIANHVLGGDGFVYQHLGTPYLAFAAPAYPFFCAAIYAITDHSGVAILVIQCIVSALVCAQVRSVGRLVFRDPMVGSLGAWFVAVHPGLVMYASRLHPLTLTTGVFLWVVWAWLSWLRHPTGRGAVQLGVACGVALLFRGTIGPFLMLAAAWFLWYTALPRLRAIKLLVIVVVVAGALVSPWLIRNTIHFRRFPVFQTTFAEVFWRGNNPQASGTSWLPDGRTVLSAAPEAFHRRLAQLDEVGQSQFFFEEARHFIRLHPWRALELYGRKFVAFWWVSSQSSGGYPSRYLEGYLLFSVPLAACALLGMWRVRWRVMQAEVLLLVGFALSIAAVQSLCYVEGRHGWTVAPLLLLRSAVGVLALVRGRAWKPLSR